MLLQRLCYFTHLQTFTVGLSPTAAMHSPRRSCRHYLRDSASTRLAIRTPMEAFIKTQLRPVDACVVCTEPFSATHQPVALDCKHIFGHKCIAKWVQDGRGNTASCPVCRHILVARHNPKPVFDASSIWKRLCDLPLNCLHILMGKLWIGIRNLWKRNPEGKFTVRDLLEKVIFPALIEAGEEGQHDSEDAFTDAYNIIAASWDSLGRPDRADGLAIPLVRLARLVSSASATLPSYLTDLSRTTHLLWRANACLGLTEENISWAFIMQASELDSDQHFPLLHLYTVLVSQSIAHKSGPQRPLPTRRHEIMNLVLEKCFTKIGKASYAGKPSNAFKDTLVFVFQELWRYQNEQARLSLRGHAGEDTIVRGIWAIAGWSVRRDRY